jgi:RecA-family ATPase
VLIFGKLLNNMNNNLSNNPLSLEAIRAHVSDLLAQPKPNHSLFMAHSGNQWLSLGQKQTTPVMLFAEFWFDGELCILFADTNLGKSILAVQIADCISKGKSLNYFPVQAPAQPVLYFDFELSTKQFENRYSQNYANHYIFADDFTRIAINPDAIYPENLTFDEYLYQCFEETIIAHNARVLIIDNLTYLRTETEKAKDALPLMKQLKALKNKYNLSILVLAHTPKRDLSKPITRNDLSGSKMLINFCDSAFAVGESSKDKNLRYLKQIKQRNTEQLYGADNVIVCQVVKPTNFLQFEVITFGKEHEHLKEANEQETNKLHQQVYELHQQNLSIRQIASQLSLTYGKVQRIVKRFTGIEADPN